MRTFFIALLISCFLSGCLSPSTENGVEPLTHNHGLIQAYADEHGITVTEAETFFLTTYKITEKGIYENLPPIPTDFETWNQKWKSGNAEWMNETPYEVYAQPEFYPTFQTTGKKAWVSASEQPVIAIGIATTPATQTSPVLEGENTIETTLFISNTWGGTQHQGMKLIYDVDPDANIALQFEPAEFVIGPAFPAFDANWVQKVHVTGTIIAKKDTPYTIRIRVTNPSNESAEKWSDLYPDYENASPFFVAPEGIATLSLIPMEPLTVEP